MLPKIIEHFVQVIYYQKLAERSKQPLGNMMHSCPVQETEPRWFDHVSRPSGLAKTILLGTVKGNRKRGSQKKKWNDNTKEWTGIDFARSIRVAENRTRWRGIAAKSSVVPQRPCKTLGQSRYFIQTRARLFKTNDIISLRVVKISNVNISNKPIFFVEKMCEAFAVQKLLSFFFKKKVQCIWL